MRRSLTMGRAETIRCEGPARGRRRQSIAVVAMLLATLAPGCRAPDQAAAPANYQHIVSTFYVGLAALQVGDDVRAQSTLAEMTQIAPDEPAGWANYGLL